MKGHSTFSRSPELEPHHQMQFSLIHRIVCLEKGKQFKYKLSKSELYYFLNTIFLDNLYVKVKSLNVL